MEQRTIALRVEPDFHAKLTLVAQLSGRPLTDLMREALDEYISRISAELDLTAAAKKALEEIEADASARRSAIQSLLTKPSDPTPPAKKPRSK